MFFVIALNGEVNWTRVSAVTVPSSFRWLLSQRACEDKGDEPVSRDLIDVDDDDATSTAAPSRVRTSGRKRKDVDDELYERC